MGKKNKDEIVDENVKSNGSSKLPLLIFLIGLFLIVAGFLMEIGWFGENESVPTTETTTEETSTNESNETTSSESSNSNLITNGIAFVIEPNVGYSTADGKLNITATSVSSTCDATTGVCGSQTDLVNLNVTDSTGSIISVVLTAAAPSSVVGTYTISISKWNDGSVELVVLSSDSTQTTGN